MRYTMMNRLIKDRIVERFMVKIKIIEKLMGKKENVCVCLFVRGGFK
jgi:hypothetical protein